MARKGFAYYGIGRGLGEPKAAAAAPGLLGGLSLRVLVTGAAGFIGFFVARSLLARGDRVTGLDNLNDYYDPALKAARLAELDRMGGDWRFRRADLADAAAVAAAFAEPNDGPFDRVIHLAAQAGVRYSLENPRAYVEANLVGLHQPARGRPCGEDPAPGLRLDLERLRRQYAHALLRGPGGRPPAAVLRRHQAGERADGAFLRASLRPALHRLALLHRLRPLGPARHGADDLRRRDQRREAAPAVQRRQPQPRLHLRRGHRRGGGAGVRRHRDARSGLGPGGPRPRHLGGAVPDLQHRQRRPGPAPRLHRRARAGARANGAHARTCRRSPATCPTPGPTAPGSRPPPAGGPRPRSRTASPASPPGTATSSAGNCPDAFPGSYDPAGTRAGARRAGPCSTSLTVARPGLRPRRASATVARWGGARQASRTRRSGRWCRRRPATCRPTCGR